MNYLALGKVIMEKLKTLTTHCEETLQGAVHGARERDVSVTKGKRTDSQDSFSV